VELTLLRHGIPVEPERWSGIETTRPLTPAGRAQVEEVVAKLMDSGKLAVDAIWSSPFARCEQTARIVADALGLPLALSPALASGAVLLRSLPRIQGDPARWPERLLCVGHSPDLGNLIGELVSGTQRFDLGRCGLARLSGKFAACGMQLEWLKTAQDALSGK
jgi:phosphohistidine phosphatase SixA